MMKNKVIIIVILLAMLILGCGDKVQPHKTEALTVVLNPLQPFEYYSLDGTLFTSEEDTALLIEDTLAEIADTLNMQYWWEEINPTAVKLYCDISFSDSMSRSWTEAVATRCGDDGLNGSICLSTLNFTDGDLAHELTHMMGYMGGFSKSLDEGLCEYVYRNVGKDCLFPKDWDVQDFAAFVIQPDYKNDEIRPYIEEFITHIGASETGYPYGEGQKLAYYYLYSQSFVTYLIDNYGVDSVKELILKGDGTESYNTYLGIDYDTVKQEWVDYILSIQPSITFEDVRQFSID